MKQIWFVLLIILSFPVTASNDVECLALNIYHEARGEGTEGWLAVAFVTINRMESKKFPNTICEVVYQYKQFSWTDDELPDKPDLSKYADKEAWKYIQQFSKGVLENYEYIVDPTNVSMYYHTYQVSPYWRESFNEAVRIGSHIFYRERYDGR